MQQRQQRSQLYVQALETAIRRELGREYSFGCVNFYHQGSHRDMDYHSFLRSTAVLLYELEHLQWQKIKDFASLRLAGQEIETKMLAVNAGINCQKGLLFLQLFLLKAYVEGWLDPVLESVTSTECMKPTIATIKDFAAPLRLDYQNLPTAKFYLESGIADVRTLPLNGFSGLFKYLHQPTIAIRNDVLLTVMLLADIDDTTTFNRAKRQGINYWCLKQRLRSIGRVANNAVVQDKVDLNTELAPQNGLMIDPEIRALNQYYLDNNLTSGGVADVFTSIRCLQFLKE